MLSALLAMAPPAGSAVTLEILDSHFALAVSTGAVRPNVEAWLRPVSSIDRDGVRPGTSHRDISDANPGNMARTVGLTRTRFLDLVDCPLTREQFEEQVGL